MTHTLIMCSGSVNSFAASVQAVRTSATKSVHLHHVKLIDSSQNPDKREKVFKYLINYCKEYYEDISLTYTYSEFHIKSIDSIRKDYIANNVAAQITQKQRELKLEPLLFVVMGYHLPDQAEQRPSDDGYRRQMDIFGKFSHRYRDSFIPPILRYPLQGLTEEDIENLLGSNVLRDIRILLQ